MKTKLIFFIILFVLIISCCVTVKEPFVDDEMMNNICNMKGKDTCEDDEHCKLETPQESANRHNTKCQANGKNCELKQKCVINKK